MAKNIILVSEKEIKKLTNFLEKTARNLKQHSFNLKHEELSPYLADPNDHNRIRTQMRVELKNLGIGQVYHVDGYTFTMPVSFDINSEPKEQIQISDENPFYRNLPPIATQTKFRYPYQAPPIFPAVREAVARGYNVGLIGSPGTGKSRMGEEIAAMAGIQHLRTTASRVQDPSELIGQYQLVTVDGKVITKFIGGVFTTAVQNGYILIMDELDNASAAANEAFKQITEDGGNLVIQTEDGVKVIEKHPHFRMIVTSNTWCRGDATNLYSNAKTQNAALLSRFGPWFELDYNYDIEERLVGNILPKHIVDLLYAFDERNPKDASKNGIVRLIREKLKSDDIPDYLNFRSILRFAETYLFMGWNLAFMTSIIHSMDPLYKDAICKVVESKVGKCGLPTEDLKFIKNHKTELEKANLAMPTFNF